MDTVKALDLRIPPARMKALEARLKRYRAAGRVLSEAALEKDRGPGEFAKLVERAGREHDD